MEVVWRESEIREALAEVAEAVVVGMVTLDAVSMVMVVTMAV